MLSMPKFPPPEPGVAKSETKAVIAAFNAHAPFPKEILARALQ